MRILVTGADGFVGGHLVRALLDTTDVEIVAAVMRSPMQPLFGAKKVVSMDVTDAERVRAVFHSVQPDAVVHLAALPSVGQSFSVPEKMRQVNVEGSRHVLEAARHLPSSPRVLMIGSAEEYGSIGADPVTEKPVEDLAPQNPYAESKVAVERLVEESFADITIRTRSFPHVGPGQGLGFVAPDFASQIARAEIGGQEPVLRVGNLEAIRDVTDVRDVVRAYILLLEKGKPGEVYNVCTGVGRTMRSILDTLLTHARVTIRVEHDPEKLRPSDIPVLIGDNEKLVGITGWKPSISMEKSLQDILDDWRMRISKEAATETSSRIADAL